MTNETLMQYFEWYLPNDGKHWKRLAADASHLAQKGITKIWMPPAFKATHDGDVGYGVYDLFDLGEFNQKGTIRTKYGTKADYLEAISALKSNGIEPLADVILNHKAAADHTETFKVVEVAPEGQRSSVSLLKLKVGQILPLMVATMPITILNGIGITLLAQTMMLELAKLAFSKFKETIKAGQTKIWLMVKMGTTTISCIPT